MVREIFSADVIPLLLVDTIPLLGGNNVDILGLILYVFPADNFIMYLN